MPYVASVAQNISSGTVTYITTYSNRDPKVACPDSTSTNTYPMPTVLSNWWTVSGPGSFATNGGGLSASFSPTNAGGGTITFYTRWSGVCDTNSHPDSISTNFTIFTISHLCFSPIPSDRTRTTLGVGELVYLSLTPIPHGVVTWSVAGGGSIDPATPITFTAPDVMANCTVVASYDEGSCSVSFDVIPPRDVFFDKDDNAGDKHIHGQTSAGFFADFTILPTTVSFYAIEVREDAAPIAFASGNWIANIGPHIQWPEWVTIGYNNIGKQPDRIDSLSPIVGSDPGGYSWHIPWRYHVGTGEGYPFAFADHVFTADQNGTATQSKSGANTASTAAIPLNARSTDWTFGQ